MEKHKSFCYLALLTFFFLLVVFLPCRQAWAFRVTLEREGVPLSFPEEEQYRPSPVSPAPVVPGTPGPGPDQEPEPGSDEDILRFSPASRTTGRGGTYVPAAPVERPSLPPETPPDTTPTQDPSQQPDAVPDAPSWLTPDEARAFVLLNEFRAENNLPPLQIHSGLVEVARLKAQDIADNDYFSHVSPTYGSISQMLRSAGISYNRAAENLSKAGNVSQAHVQLVYSTKGHRQIMLSPDYNYVGIGILPLKGVPGIIMVQLYID
jgi:uncharacterized protein YkwD